MPSVEDAAVCGRYYVLSDHRGHSCRQIQGHRTFILQTGNNNGRVLLHSRQRLLRAFLRIFTVAFLLFVSPARYIL